MRHWIVQPRSWSTTNDLVLMKLPPVWFFSHGNRGIMSFESNIYRHSQLVTVEGWRRAIEAQNDAHSSKIEPVESTGGPSEFVCLKITNEQLKGQVEISCLLFNAQWKANYIGPEQTASEFTDVIRNIK